MREREIIEKGIASDWKDIESVSFYNDIIFEFLLSKI